jgi:hypothetical protein
MRIKGYFACYIDDSFLKRDFLIKAVDRVDSEIEDIKKVINECEEKGSPHQSTCLRSGEGTRITQNLPIPSRRNSL